MSRPQPTHALRAATDLDAGARRALLRTLLDEGISTSALVDAFMRRGAFGDLRDYLRAVDDVHGRAVGLQVIETLREAINDQTDATALDWETDLRQATHAGAPRGLLLGMPAPDFLTALELGVSTIAGGDASLRATEEINRVCGLRGIHYRLAGSPPAFEWTGELEVHENAIAPALSVLDDPRLRDGPRVEFDSARREVRTNTRESRKQAIAEGCNAVESMMKILCELRGVTVAANASAQPLFNALVGAGVVPRETEEMVLGVTRYGNRRGRHGGGPVAHDVTEAEGEQAVAAAAVAIVYLARHLP